MIALQQAGETEIRHARFARIIEQNIGRLQVAMKHAVLMRLLHRAGVRAAWASSGFFRPAASTTLHFVAVNAMFSRVAGTHGLSHVSQPRQASSGGKFIWCGEFRGDTCGWTGSSIPKKMSGRAAESRPTNPR